MLLLLLYTFFSPTTLLPMLTPRCLCSPASPAGVFGQTRRYRLADTTPLDTPPWGGVLNTANPTPLRVDQLQRTPQNLYMNGVPGTAQSSLTTEIHAGEVWPLQQQPWVRVCVADCKRLK